MYDILLPFSNLIPLFTYTPYTELPQYKIAGVITALCGSGLLAGRQFGEIFTIDLVRL